MQLEVFLLIILFVVLAIFINNFCELFKIFKPWLQPAIFYPLRPRYTAQFYQQLVSQCRCETSCRRTAQCNMGCLAIFYVARSVARRRTQLYYSQRIATTGNTNIAQLLPSSNYLPILRQFLQEHMRTLLVFCSEEFWVREQAYSKWLLSQKYCKLLRSRCSVTIHPTSATYNATFSSIAREVAEKIALCNRAIIDIVDFSNFALSNI